MPFRDEIDAIDDRIDAKTAPPFVSGMVTSVNSNTVRIRVAGSSRTVKAYYDDGSPPSVGKRCLAALEPSQNRYVVVAAFSGTGSYTGIGNRQLQDFALAPPNDFEVLALPAALLARWNDPIAQSLAFEIQTNTSAVEAGATTVLTTRGVLVIPTATSLYVRVRSVSSSFRFSSWSDWETATPDPIYDTFAELLDVDVSTPPTDGQVPVWDDTAEKWVPGTAGSSFSGDAFDVPYTPTTSSNWSSVPTDAGEALDTLAADLAAVGGGSGGAEALVLRWSLFR